MSFIQARNFFLKYNKPFKDYWALVRQWAVYTNALFAKGQITERQKHKWRNPCTPISFKKFNAKFKGEKYGI